MLAGFPPRVRPIFETSHSVFQFNRFTFSAGCTHRHRACILLKPFLAFAHLALCAAAILARPSALIFLRLGADRANPRFSVAV
jgi:hypothetical protein